MKKIEPGSGLTITVILAVLVLLISCSQNNDNNQHQHSTAKQEALNNYADSINAGIIPKDTLKGSPVRTAMANIGNNHVHIRYGSPGVRGRIIWGGLVAYDEVWATGAHDATSVEFSKDVVIGGVNIPSGKYGFFSIPGKDTWALILNKNWDQHLADEYAPQDDVIRVTIKPETNETTTQRLTYTIRNISDTEGEIVMEWEHMRIVLPFKNSH